MGSKTRNLHSTGKGAGGPAGAWRVTRRTFLQASAGSLAGLVSASCVRGVQRLVRRPVRFGLVADSHYADREPAGVRFYGESLTKMGECVDLMNSERVDFVVELGDFKDQDSPPDSERTTAYLQGIENEFSRFAGPRFHALGNHDMDSLSKAQFLGNVTNTGIPEDKSYYSCDVGGLHVVVLDANFRSDGKAYDHGNFDWTDPNVPAAELAWLEKDLGTASAPAAVFLHQRLDGEGKVFVKNAAEVQGVLERSGKVLAVFQGHHHEGACTSIQGIHYYTLKAMVEGSGAESNSYAIAELARDGSIVVTGYRRAETTELAVAGAGAL